LQQNVHLLGYTIAHLVEALHYKPEGLEMSIELFIDYDPEVDLASKRNEYPVSPEGKGDRCVWQTSLPPS
jgi:hypothetical protein